MTTHNHPPAAPTGREGQTEAMQVTQADRDAAKRAYEKWDEMSTLESDALETCIAEEIAQARIAAQPPPSPVAPTDGISIEEINSAIETHDFSSADPKINFGTYIHDSLK
jgi:hypothetical protein